jgi:hypothetical protein
VTPRNPTGRDFDWQASKAQDEASADQDAGELDEHDRLRVSSFRLVNIRAGRRKPEFLPQHQ